jgi:oligoribonuclease NrnB/cAMP/cGMP phosphodiesterase (DHH superfamily)
MKPIIVFYHADCPDGFGAAWSAWKKFGNKAGYIAIKASQTPDQLGKAKTKGRDIYFLDVCASSANLRELAKNNCSVTIIDHHETNRETVRHASQWYFDMSHSASVLSWLYFFPEKPVPKLLRYVEDNDIWKFRLPHSVEISLWLGLFKFDFKIWDKLVRDLGNKSTFAKHAKEGRLLQDYEDGVIRGILKNAYEVKFRGYPARVANTSISHSIVGNLLIDKRHPIGIVWYESGNTRKYSLRSKGATDVSKLAKQFPGGGGHKHASGFTLPAGKPFPWKIVKSNNSKR